MHPILKPGTVVRIKQLQKFTESATGCFITREMSELSGSVVKISGIFVHHPNPLLIRYKIDLDEGGHCWAIDLFTATRLLKRKPL